MNDRLYGADLRATTTPSLLRPEGGWHGEIGVADDYLFLQRDNDLFVAKGDGLNVQDPRHVDNGGGFKDGPIGFYANNEHIYHMAPSDGGSNLYARNIDAPSAHLGGGLVGLHALTWSGAMAVAVLPQAPPPAWWLTIQARAPTAHNGSPLAPPRPPSRSPAGRDSYAGVGAVTLTKTLYVPSPQSFSNTCTVGPPIGRPGTEAGGWAVNW